MEEEEISQSFINISGKSKIVLTLNAITFLNVQNLLKFKTLFKFKLIFTVLFVYIAAYIFGKIVYFLSINFHFIESKTTNMAVVLLLPAKLFDMIPRDLKICNSQVSKKKTNTLHRFWTFLQRSWIQDFVRDNYFRGNFIPLL